MQEQQPYRQFGKETATFIVELVNNQSGGYEFLEFRDDGHTPGVYVSETYIGLFPSGGEGIEAGNVFEWNPACDTEDDTDPEAAPLLPVPFTAKELAAFLLYGVGNYIQERLGRIGQLDEDQLSKLGGVRKKLPRQALRAAYVEAERAQQIVGLPDIEAQELAYSLTEQLDEAEREENHSQGVFARDISPEEASRRRALVVESLADLRKRTQIAKSEAAAKAAQWRGAMVRQLLEPLPQTPEQPVSAGANREELARLRAEAEARRQDEERKAAEERAAEGVRLAAERAEIARQREAQEAKAREVRAELDRQAAELRAQQEAVRKRQEESAAEVKRLEDERIEAEARRIERAPGGALHGAGGEPRDYEQELEGLFDSVGSAQLEAMFPDNEKWAKYAERAARNGLALARVGRGKFNPYLAARWWINEQCPAGWDWSRCARQLANNLPARSRDSRHLLTGDFD